MDEKIRILVADDNQLILAIASDTLAAAGYEVFQASHGQQVYQEVIKNRPHLVLLDIMMPGIDGIEVCRNLKRAPKTKDILVVVHSGKKDPDLMDLVSEFGADGFIIKTNDYAGMLARIKEILREKLGREI